MANFEQKLSITVLLLFAVVPLALCQKTCDIGGCYIVFKSVFSDLLSNDLEHICRDIKEVLKCLNDCNAIFLPHFVSANSTISFLNEVCTGDFLYDITIHWECIRQHLNRLLVCVATSNSLEYRRSNKKNELLSCKKVLSMLDCPQDVLYNQCEDEAVEAVNEAFRSGLKSVLAASCFKISNDKVSSLDVQPRLDTRYRSTAICMDYYSHLADSCLDEYLEKAAHSELNSCSEDAGSVCNKAFSTSSCSSQPLVSSFYPSIFSYGKQVCNTTPSNLYHKKPNRIVNATDIHEREFQENMKTEPPATNTTWTLSSTSIEEAVTPTVEEFDTTFSFSVDTKPFDSTLHFETSNEEVFDFDFMHSTVVSNSTDSETVLSDAPRNFSNAEIEGSNHTSNEKNITISNNYHTSCGGIFVPFPCTFLIVAFMLLH